MIKSAPLEVLTRGIMHSPEVNFALLTNISATSFNFGAVERQPLE